GGQLLDVDVIAGDPGVVDGAPRRAAALGAAAELEDAGGVGQLDVLLVVPDGDSEHGDRLPRRRRERGDAVRQRLAGMTPRTSDALMSFMIGASARGCPRKSATLHSADKVTSDDFG